MADRFFQCLCARTVLHGQIHTYLGNIHIRHDAAHGELICVGQGRGRSPSLRDRRIGQHSIVLLCRLPLGGQFGIIGVRNNCGVSGFHVRMIFFTQKFSYQRVKQKPQRHNTASRRQ